MLTDNDIFNQTYFVSVYGKVELIFPLQSKEKLINKKSKYE